MSYDIAALNERVIQLSDRVDNHTEILHGRGGSPGVMSDVRLLTETMEKLNVTIEKLDSRMVRIERVLWGVIGIIAAIKFLAELAPK